MKRRPEEKIMLQIQCPDILWNYLPQENDCWYLWGVWRWGGGRVHGEFSGLSFYSKAQFWHTDGRRWPSNTHCVPVILQGFNQEDLEGDRSQSESSAKKQVAEDSDSDDDIDRGGKEWVFLANSQSAAQFPFFTVIFNLSLVCNFDKLIYQTRQCSRLHNTVMRFSCEIFGKWNVYFEREFVLCSGLICIHVEGSWNAWLRWGQIHLSTVQYTCI